MLDAEWQGHPRKLLVQANRNGFLYVLDRTNGSFLKATAMGNVTWATSIGPNGRPVLNPDLTPKPEGNRVCPGALGLTNWYSPSYSPGTGLLYVATSDECDIFTAAPQPYREGHDILGSVYVPDPVVRPTGALKALDPMTGQIKWAFQYFSNPNGGALSTAGGLVFAGESDGNFIALDSRTGKDLWHVQLGASDLLHGDHLPFGWQAIRGRSRRVRTVRVRTRSSLKRLRGGGSGRDAPSFKHRHSLQSATAGRQPEPLHHRCSGTCCANSAGALRIRPACASCDNWM